MLDDRVVNRRAPTPISSPPSNSPREVPRCTSSARAPRADGLGVPEALLDQQYDAGVGRHRRGLAGLAELRPRPGLVLVARAGVQLGHDDVGIGAGTQALGTEVYRATAELP